MAYLNTEENADFVRIYDADPNNGGVLLHEFSGNTFNPTESFISYTGMAYVTFQTNSSVTAPGWKLRFTAKRNTTCTSASFEEPSGTFTDGSEEDEYASDANCRWIIAPTNASWVRLNFNEFDISDEDFVNVYKGTSTSNLTLIGTYNNATPPPSSITNTNGGMMKVEFRSDCYIQRSGFSAEWTSDGEEDIEDPNSVTDHKNLDFETFPNPANTTVGIIVPKNFKDGKVRIT